MRFRRAVGLQADEAWVRMVAANPAAHIGSSEYVIPLLPQELAFLAKRADRLEDAMAFGESYGAEFPDGFAGATIDTAAHDQLVLLYTRDLDQHRLRFSLMPVSSRPEVRPARWTLQELEQFQTRISGDPAPDPRITIYGTRIDVLSNQVVVDFGAATADLGNGLIARYGATGWLGLRWFGPVQAGVRPTGSIILTILGPDGAPVPEVQCRYATREVGVVADGGVDSSSGGVCKLTNLPLGRYRVQILDADEQVDRILDTLELTVIAGETQRMTVKLPD